MAASGAPPRAPGLRVRGRGGSLWQEKAVLPPRSLSFPQQSFEVKSNLCSFIKMCLIPSDKEQVSNLGLVSNKGHAQCNLIFPDPKNSYKEHTPEGMRESEGQDATLRTRLNERRAAGALPGWAVLGQRTERRDFRRSSHSSRGSRRRMGQGKYGPSSVTQNSPGAGGRERAGSERGGRH